MSDDSKAMDVYSDIRIPFSIAAWCRQHRFSPLAARLAKALRESADLKNELDSLERKDRTLYAEIKSIVDSIERKDAEEENVKQGVLPKRNSHIGVVRRVKAEGV